MKKRENCPTNPQPGETALHGAGVSFDAQTPFINVYKRIPANLPVTPLPPLATINLPVAFRELLSPARYKIWYGGRAGVKSWSFAQALLLIGMRRTSRMLCAREYQASLADSVKSLLDDLIARLKLRPFYKSRKTYIEGRNGTEFKFSGLRVNPTELKSFEGADYCWVEEGQRVSAYSWDILIPTIRKPDSEIWCSFNPDLATDPTYKRFVLQTPPSSIVRKVGYRDNPWFSSVLEMERLHMLETDPEAYRWIWEGECRTVSEACVFRGKYTIMAFETPKDAKFRYGLDWGFGPDPTAGTRSFVKDGCLFIDYEAYARECALNDLPEVLIRSLPGVKRARLWADNSQPQSIKHLNTFSFNCRGAKKWPGSVEDGLGYLKSFKHIYVHERCYYTGQEMALYSYKTDKLTGQVIMPPALVDRHNHCIDSLRYGQEGFIGNRRKKLVTSSQARMLAHGL